MTTERRLQIATAITTISEVYERELSPAAVAIYVTTLQPFEPQLIIKALQRHVEDPERGRFMPRPGRHHRPLEARRQRHRIQRLDGSAQRDSPQQGAEERD